MVEAMVAMVLADHLLRHHAQCVQGEGRRNTCCSQIFLAAIGVHAARAESNLPSSALTLQVPAAAGFHP